MIIWKTTHLISLKIFVELFKLNAFTHEEMKLKIVSQTLSNMALIWHKALST
jgi:hypothetical protein